MKTDYEFLLKYKSEYKELSHKISKLRHNGEKVSKDLFLNAVAAGCLADIPDDELNVLLFNPDNH